MHRFALLFKKELGENFRRTLGIPVLVVGVIMVVTFWSLLNMGIIMGRDFFNTMSYTLPIISWMGFVIGVCIFDAANTFCSMKTKSGRIATLMLPATDLEKFLVRWVITVPMSIVLYYAGIFLVDAMQYVVTWMIAGKGKAVFVTWGEIFSGATPLLYFCLILQSLCVLGSSIWAKSLLRTFAWLVVLFFVLSSWYSTIGYCMAASLSTMEQPPALKSIIDFLNDYVFNEYFLAAFTLLVCSVNYVLAYFRFKENEIIDRW